MNEHDLQGQPENNKENLTFDKKEEVKKEEVKQEEIKTEDKTSTEILVSIDTTLNNIYKVERFSFLILTVILAYCCARALTCFRE